MNKIKITEKVDIDAINYLLSIDLNAIKGSDYKDYLEKTLISGGVNKVVYNYAKRKKYGRLYNFQSLQNIKSDIRSFLTQNNYNDYDIVNCQPSILKYITDTYFPNNSFPTLNKYILKRKELLTDKIDKHFVIMVMNNQNYKNNIKHEFFNSLFNEFDIIRNLVWDSPPFDYVIKPPKKEDNHKGSFISNIVQELENIHLLESINKLNKSKIGALIYDGFYYDIDEPIQTTLNTLNDNKYGLKWIVKPNKSSIVIDSSRIINKPIKTYSTVKTVFEKNYFMIQNPVMYGWEHKVKGKNVLATYNLSDFRTLTAPYEYAKVNNGGEPEMVNFLNEWIKDSTARKFKAVDNIPYPIGTIIENNTEVYNEFNGFDTDLITEEEYKRLDGDKYVKIMADHIKLLTNNDEKSFIYLAKYIAHLFQYPNELPLIAILFKSEEGVGKDSLVEIIEKILGTDYIFRAEDASSLFGEKNGDSRKGKLIIQLNELKASDGKKYESDIKGLITTVKNNIRELYKNSYKQKNNARVIASVNTENPFKVSSSDRRWAVFRCGQKKDEEYYDTLYREVVLNPNGLKCIAYSFLTMDIAGFNIKDRPITDAYNEMKSHSCNPLYKFLYDLFYTGQYKEIATSNKKTPTDIRIDSNHILSSYTHYLSSNNLVDSISINSRTLSVYLQTIGVKKKRVKIDGRVKEPFIFDINTIVDTLKIKTNLNDDDIEDESSDDIIGYNQDQGFIN